MLFLFNWFCLSGNEYWYLLIFGLLVIITYQLMIYDIPPDDVFGKSQPWYSNLSFYYIFDPNRDAQAESRTAHPMDEDIRFSTNIEIIDDDERFGIQDTQAHHMAILDNFNNIQRTDVLVNNGNDSINEDATLYNNVDNNIIVPVIQNGESQRPIITRSSAVVVLNDSRSNQTNPIDQQPVSTISVRETQRRFGTRQTITVASCSTSTHLARYHTAMELSDDSDEESAV